jgi:hypothetical protein
MTPLARSLIVAAAVTLPAWPSHAIDYRCRTSPVGTSEPYCASEAFVTSSIGRVPVRAFSGLPSCASGNTGQTIFITDSNVSTFNANITAGSGGNAGLAVCNGTNWTFH